MFIEVIIATTFLADGKKLSKEDLESIQGMLISESTKAPFAIKTEIGVAPYGQLISTKIIELEDGEFALIGKGELFSIVNSISLWDGTPASSSNATEMTPFPLRGSPGKLISVSFDSRKFNEGAKAAFIENVKALDGSEQIEVQEGKGIEPSIAFITMNRDLTEVAGDSDLVNLCCSLLKGVVSEQLEACGAGARVSTILEFLGTPEIEFVLHNVSKIEKGAGESKILQESLLYARELQKNHGAEKIQFIFLGGEWKLNYFKTSKGEVVCSDLGKSRVGKSVRSALRQLSDPIASGRPYRFTEEGTPDPEAEAAKNFYDQNYRQIYANQNKDSKMKSKAKWTGNCRFCGRARPLVTFENISHAFPESMGNKSIVCDSECDQCNETFGSGIENDFGKWILPLRLVSQISGKQGLPKYSSGTLEIAVTQTGLNLKAQEDDGAVKIDPESKKLSVKIPTDSYVPIAVLKTFIKMAISIMAEADLQKFQGAIDWLRNSDHKVPLDGLCSKGLYTFFSGVPELKNIQAILLIRTSDDVTLPFATFVIKFGNAAFQIFLPTERTLQERGRFEPVAHPLLLATDSTGTKLFDLSQTEPTTETAQEFEFLSDSITLNDEPPPA